MPVTLMSIVVTAIILTLLLTAKAQAQTYYLGVLAPQGEAAAQDRWQPWLDQLNNKLSDDTIVLVPLGMENWQEQIAAQKFAFVLGPQVQFIRMDTVGWRWLATLQAQTQAFEPTVVNQKSFKPADKYDLFAQLETDKEAKLLNEPSAMEQIASALWVKSSSNIYNVRDLQQRKIVAVDPDAFGGYLLIAQLLQKNGLPPSRYQTQFVGFPVERTLSTLASGAVDAAIAPLCLMEEMARQGKIDKTQYRIINPVVTTSSCESSTKIYPNWTLAATSDTPALLTAQMNQHLFAPQQQTMAGNDSDKKTIDKSDVELRWLPPESSVDAERILYEMNRHPAQQQLGTHILNWIQTHRWWMGIIVFIVAISTINYGWMSWLALRRRQQILMQNQLIRDYDHRLQQSERFAVVGEMSGAIAHEINQPLATIQNYAQGLLIRSQKKRLDEDTDTKNIRANQASTEKAKVEKQSIENALQQIVSETERVAAVISNIRRWAGRSQPDEISVDVAATYQQCIILLGERAVGISFWYASEYQHLQLPSLLLDQLMINPMLNAQQQGAKHIMLSLQRVEFDDTLWLALSITDDAGGFDESRLSTNQSSSPTNSHQPHSQYGVSSTKAEGLGLGLMICQRLCKSVGGIMQLRNVEVSNELNTIQTIDEHYCLRYRLRLSRSLNNTVQRVSTESAYSLANKTGAQVTLYLPLHLAENNESN